MKKYKLVAFTNAVIGKDVEFNCWYDDQHLPDVLSIPGFISAERMVCVGEGPHRYMTIYEIETDDFDGTLAEFSRRPGTDAMKLSNALDMDTTAVGFWQELRQA